MEVTVVWEVEIVAVVENLSLMPLKSDWSHCIMEAMPRSRPQGFFFFHTSLLSAPRPHAQSVTPPPIGDALQTKEPFRDLAPGKKFHPSASHVIFTIHVKHPGFTIEDDGASSFYLTNFVSSLILSTIAWEYIGLGDIQNCYRWNNFVK